MLRPKWNALRQGLEKRERVLVAFSGGCDSAFLLAAARKALGRENMLAVTAVSASLPEREKDAAQKLAILLDAPHEFLWTDELANPSYASNPTNRCFFCKDELFEKLTPVAQGLGMVGVDGFNASDRADYR